MVLYLVQHGTAKTEAEDPARSLTEEGKRTVERVAEHLSTLSLALDRIEHSDKLRARQTAEIFAAKLHPAYGTVLVSSLAPNDDVELTRVRLNQETATVMLVGHLPHLSRLVSRLFALPADHTVVRFQMGGVVKLERDDTGHWVLCWILAPELLLRSLNPPMTTTDKSAHPKLDNILVATNFSSASKTALLYAMSIARRHTAKLFVVHVSSSQSEGNLTDAWRAGHREIMDHLMAGRLVGVQYELLVKSGDVWPVLSHLIEEYEIDLVVVGTRGRTGVLKLLLGSVAEKIFRQASCPVLTVGPSISGQDPEVGPQRILVPTGFAPQSLYAVKYALWLAQELQSSLALLHVITDRPGMQDQERIRSERMARLRALIPSREHLPSPPESVVEFGEVSEKILETATRWNPNLIVMGLHHIEEASRTETTWAKAYEIVCSASCPVLTVRTPE